MIIILSDDSIADDKPPNTRFQIRNEHVHGYEREYETYRIR